MPRLSQAKIVGGILIIYVVIGFFAPHFDPALETTIINDVATTSEPEPSATGFGAVLNVITNIPVIGGLIGFLIDVTNIVTTIATFPAQILLTGYPVFVKLPFAVLGIVTYIVIAFYGITVIKMLPTT